MFSENWNEGKGRITEKGEKMCYQYYSVLWYIFKRELQHAALKMFICLRNTFGEVYLVRLVYQVLHFTERCCTSLLLIVYSTDQQPQHTFIYIAWMPLGTYGGDGEFFKLRAISGRVFRMQNPRPKSDSLNESGF